MKQLLIYLFAVCLFSNCSNGKQTTNLIFDTDMAPDYDDVGALAALHALADSGEVKILATVSSNKCETTVPCIDVINTYFGRPDIPVGCVKGDAPNLTTWHREARWTDELPKRYPHKAQSASESEDALKVYRRILSLQPDTSVTIVTVGFFSNLKNLLQSQPDEYSKLSGADLVKKKVKLLVAMAGRMPQGKEFNVEKDSTASVVVFEEWPTPIILSGWDIGNEILTGKRLASSDIQGSPIVDAFSMCLPQDNPEGRMSWDQTAVLVAVRGAAPYFKLEKGIMKVFPDGSNTWTADPKGLHSRLIFQMPIPQLTNIIEDLMLHKPQNKQN